MKIRIFETDNGVVLQDVETSEVVCIVEKEGLKWDVYKELGKRIYEEWLAVRKKIEDKDVTYGVTLDVNMSAITTDPFVLED